MAIDARSFLDSIAGYTDSNPNVAPTSADRPIKLATIDPLWTSGAAKVTFDGESIKSSKGYFWLNTYSPVAGQRVLMLPVGQSYVIAGAAVAAPVTTATVAPTYSSGWAAYGSGYLAPYAYKSADGFVQVGGLLTRSGATIGSTTSGQVMFTLPTGYRPSANLFIQTSSRGGNGVGLSTFEINTAGAVSHFWVAANTYQQGSTTAISLEAIKFPAA